jgi:hypothetical protein
VIWDYSRVTVEEPGYLDVATFGEVISSRSFEEMHLEHHPKD